MVTAPAAVMAVSDVVGSFVFPLVLLLIGGGLTGYFYPRLAAKRQRDQTGREIRTALVAQMSEEVTTMLMTIQFVELRFVSVSQADFDAAYKRWETASAVIGTKLEAYFPRADLGRRWTDFAARVSDFYALAGIPDDETRASARRRLLRKPLDGQPTERDEWLAVRDRLLEEKARLIRDVLDSDDMNI
jgi:hypothetical protein